MNFLEKNLEDIIYENAITEEGRRKLKERGLPIKGMVFRQLYLGNYGRLDLLTIHNESYINFPDALIFDVYELKQGVINIDTLLQAGRYAKGIKRIIATNGYDLHSRESIFRIHLIGSEVDLNGDFALLFDCLCNVNLYTYSYNIDGIYFKKQYGFYRTNELLPDIKISYSDAKKFFTEI